MTIVSEYREYARQQIRDILVADHEGRLLIGDVSICDAIPLPAPLIRESEFLDRLRSLPHFIYGAPWVYLGVRSFMELGDGALDQQWPFLWRAVLAAGLAFYHSHAANKESGLFYPISLWQQSIDRRTAEFRKECRRIYQETSSKEFN